MISVAVIKVGLTGGIGCGKSAAIQMFQEKGIPVIDADLIAKQVVKPKQPALQQIVKHFGSGVLQTDGSLDRKALGKIVFNNTDKLKQLEAILHPIIRKEIEKEMEAKAHTNQVYIIVDVPLLLEQNYQALFDQIVVVDCKPEQQIKRVMNRDSISSEQVRVIMSKQAERKQRLAIADNVLANTGSLDKLREQVDQYHNKLVRLNRKMLN